MQNLSRGLGQKQGQRRRSRKGRAWKSDGEVRRAMSVQVVRSQALCLLERLAQLGPGARAAGERRKVVHRIEEIRKRQTQAYHLAQRNRGLCRVGRAFVP